MYLHVPLSTPNVLYDVLYCHSLRFLSIAPVSIALNSKYLKCNVLFIYLNLIACFILTVFVYAPISLSLVPLHTRHYPFHVQLQIIRTYYSSRSNSHVLGCIKTVFLACRVLSTHHVCTDATVISC